MRTTTAPTRNQTGDDFQRRPDRQWTDRPVLLALAAIIIGAAALGRWSGPHYPSDSSIDVGFARDMIVHHEQAVQMADKIRFRTQDEQLNAMALEIVLVQQQQIGQMLAWLDIWGIDSLNDGSYMAWMGHEVTDWREMPGMASAEDIRRLDTLPAAEAEALFLQLMTRHHMGGVDMALAAVDGAETHQVRTLAAAVAQAQHFEIERMQQLLRTRGLPPVEPLTPPAPMAGHGGHDAPAGQRSDHAEVSPATLLKEVLLVGPVALGIFAAAWLMFDALRHRTAPTLINEPAQRGWLLAAVVSLVGSAALHLVLTPAHFRESAVYGGLFLASSIGLALLAGRMAVVPERRVFLAGLVAAAALMLLWGVFRIVPLPGMDEAEEVDLVGIITKGFEVVAVIACGVLWVRSGGAAPTTGVARPSRTVQPTQTP